MKSLRQSSQQSSQKTWRVCFLMAVLSLSSILATACTSHKIATPAGADAGSTMDSAGMIGTGGVGGSVVPAQTGGSIGTLPAMGSGGAAVPDGDAVPDGGAVIDAPVGAVPCTSDQKRCNDVCVDVNDPKYGCGTATCDVSGCPAASGGTLICQNALCVLGTCTAGTKKCGDRCVAVTDPAYGCGAATCDATTCPVPGAGGSVACQAGACVIATCGAGLKKCANKCVAISDPTYGCGAATCDATACPAAGAGTLICQAGACVIGSCGAGTKKCGDRCVPTDVNNGCGDPAKCTACASNEACVGTPMTTCQCVPIPMTSACMGKCDSVSNGCGGTYSCGACTLPQACGGAMVPNVCGCTPNNMAACAGKACGPATNNCGQSVACVNTCTGINTCGGGGAGPNGCGCTPPSTMTAACAGKCGAVPDGCSGTYPCATCGAGLKCDATTHMCTPLCTGIPCGTNLKCDPATGMCVDICSGGGTGTVSHCCSARDCPVNLPLCTGGICVGRPAGQGCATNTECASTHCADGVCCNVAVCGACQACNLNGTGTCSTKCPAAAAATCGNDGTCDASGACRRFTGNVCAPGACSVRTTSHEPSTCLNGSCVAGRMCDYHGCGTDGRCTTTCPVNTFDAGNACTDKKGFGGTCTATAECAGAAGQVTCAGGVVRKCCRTSDFANCDVTNPGTTCSTATGKCGFVSGGDCNNPMQCASGVCFIRGTCDNGLHTCSELDIDNPPQCVDKTSCILGRQLCD